MCRILSKLRSESKKVLIDYNKLEVDMGGFGHRVNSDSIRNGGAI